MSTNFNLLCDFQKQHSVRRQSVYRFIGAV
jgi:hypothetical protein